jgi:PRTRC genetic system protein B
MEAQIALSTSTSFELREALLVYRSDRGGSAAASRGTNVFVTKHPVRLNSEGAPSLGPGASVAKADVVDLMEALRGSIPIEFLTPNILVRTEDSIVWWTPPTIRTMYYAKEKSVELQHLSGKRFPQPALVFRAGDNKLEVRAMVRNERPTPKTKLFRAPYWNVSDHGDVCLGNTKVPPETNAGSLARWEAAFFESEFTHANGSRKLTEHADGFMGLWKSLIGKKTFPVDCLADAEETLEKFINR